MSAAEEAVAAYRTLALANPGAFERDLVPALANLAQALARTDDRASAIRRFDEAVAEFASAHPRPPGASVSSGAFSCWTVPVPRPRSAYANSCPFSMGTPRRTTARTS
ncbi:hypothetical protein NKH18_12100 [Streptomyces sp. M10(2022)]